MTTTTEEFCRGNLAKVVRYRYWKDGDDESIVRVTEVRDVVVFPLAVGGWIFVTEAMTDEAQALFIRDDRILEIEFSNEATEVCMLTGVVSYSQMLDSIRMMKDSELGKDR